MLKKNFLALLALIVVTPIIYYQTQEHDQSEGEEEEGGPDPRQDWFIKQRIGDAGIYNKASFTNGIDFYKSKVQEYKLKNKKLNTWTLKGPSNSGGRVTDVVGDPENYLNFYVGTAAGGVWKTTNGGDDFEPIFDDLHTPAIGALAVDPNDFDTLYVGTGESNPGGGSATSPGAGIWKTEDGGSTWTFLGLEKTRFIGKILVNPSNTQIIYVAALGELFTANPERGMYKSTDGGLTWERSLYISDEVGVVDAAIDPENPQNIYASSWQRKRYPSTRLYGGPGSALWKSSDAGENWIKLEEGLPTGTLGRIGIAISPSSPNQLYSVISDTKGTFKGIYHSTNSGESWQKKNGQFSCSTYCWWFGKVFVHPTESNRIWLASVGLHKSTNSGNTVVSTAQTVHADQHAFWISPTNPSVHILGNDGGVYVTTNNGTSYKQKSLPNMQFYDVDADENGRIIGGLQDNGTYRSQTGEPNDWEHVNGGDGFTALFHPENENLVYAESQRGYFYKSTNGGASFYAANSGMSGRSNWHSPVILVKNKDTKKYDLFFGRNSLYKSSSTSVRWSRVSNDLSKGDSGSGNYGTITTLASAPSNSNTMYIGTDDGNVWVTKDYGKNYTKISDTLPQFWVTGLAVNPEDDAIAYISYSGYRSNVHEALIYKTVDYGESWEAVSNNLPALPINSIHFHPTQTDTMFVTTDVGVLTSTDKGSVWNVVGDGYPIGVPAMDLKYVPGKKRLYVATYGRGIFSIDGI